MTEVHGVDINTMMKEGFPALVFENDLFVNKIFNTIKKEIDIHTHTLPFESFISIVCSFRTSSFDEKMERFFKMIDEDGNGMLSYDEIYTLCS